MKQISLNNGNLIYRKGKTSNFAIYKSSTYKTSKERHDITSLIKQIETGTNSSLALLKKELSEQNLFFVSLQHVVTTKKSLCYILDIPIEAACRYKRNLEKLGKLVQSSYKIICPITKHRAHLLTTNPKEFDRIREDCNRQLTLF